MQSGHIYEDEEQELTEYLRTVRDRKDSLCDRSSLLFACQAQLHRWCVLLRPQEEECEDYRPTDLAAPRVKHYHSGHNDRSSQKEHAPRLRWHRSPCEAQLYPVELVPHEPFLELRSGQGHCDKQEVEDQRLVKHFEAVFRREKSQNSECHRGCRLNLELRQPPFDPQWARNGHRLWEFHHSWIPLAGSKGESLLWVPSLSRNPCNDLAKDWFPFYCHRKRCRTCWLS